MLSIDEEPRASRAVAGKALDYDNGGQGVAIGRDSPFFGEGGEAIQRRREKELTAATAASLTSVNRLHSRGGGTTPLPGARTAHGRRSGSKAPIRVGPGGGGGPASLSHQYGPASLLSHQILAHRKRSHTLRLILPAMPLPPQSAAVAWWSRRPGETSSAAAR